MLLEGRRGLIVGIANERSIAWGIARAVQQAGARLAVTYQDDRLASRVLPLAAELKAEHVAVCDLLRDDAPVALAGELQRLWGGLDFLVHAVAYAERKDLDGRFVDTDRAGFRTAMEASVYSLVALVRACEPLLRAGQAPSVLTLTYYGGEKAIPHYNVMGVAKAALESAVRYLAQDLGPVGIRVNALSCGPIKTLSAAGVRHFRQMLAWSAEQAPLRRNVTLDDVGAAALLPLSELGRGMTGEVIHVDAGYNVVGAPHSL